MTRLAEFAKIESGAGFPIADQGVADAEFPFLKVSDMNLPGNEVEIRRWNHSVSKSVRERLRARAFPANTVIFPKIGAAIATNKKRLLALPSCIDNNCMGVTGDPVRVDHRYLYYLFRTKNLSDFASDSNPPSIRKTAVESWDVTLPSLAEQQRIVDLLSRTENVVRMCEDAEQRAQEIIPALFLDMFGDPATNPQGWDVRTIGDLCSYTRYGPRFPDREYGPTGAHILRTTDMDAFGGIRWNEAPILPMDNQELEKYSLRPPVLLVTRSGTIGRLALFTGAAKPCIAGAYLIELGLNNVVCPEYVLHFLLGSVGQRELLAGARALAQANLNAPAIKAISIPIPSLTLQQTFARQAERLMALSNSLAGASEIAKEAFQSLLTVVSGEAT